MIPRETERTNLHASEVRPKPKPRDDGALERIVHRQNPYGIRG